jgi:hypothetical protein
VCGSGLKYKVCHGDPLKRAVCNRVANEKMVRLIYQEKIKRGLIKLKYHCNTCHKDFDEPGFSEIGQCQICPVCRNTWDNVIENKPEVNDA